MSVCATSRWPGSLRCDNAALRRIDESVRDEKRVTPYFLDFLVTQIVCVALIGYTGDEFRANRLVNQQRLSVVFHPIGESVVPVFQLLIDFQGNLGSPRVAT